MHLKSKKFLGLWFWEDSVTIIAFHYFIKMIPRKPSLNLNIVSLISVAL